MIQRLGVLDWGIGGLSVLKTLQERCPQMDFVYLSDSGFTPYGKLTPTDLRERVQSLLAMAAQDFAVDGFVIACNAASTVFLGEAQFMKRPLLNVIDPTVAALRRSDYRRVGVIGGLRTVESRVYSNGLGSEFDVLEVPAQPLSAMIERGQVRGPELRAFLKQLLAPLRDVEALVLACTHYPAVQVEIARLMPNVDIIDPAQILAQTDLDLRGTGTSQFFTTGDRELTRSAAHLAFGFAIGEIKTGPIPEIRPESPECLVTRTVVGHIGRRAVAANDLRGRDFRQLAT